MASPLGSLEGPYVNSKVRTATGFSADKRIKTVRYAEWYNQAGHSRSLSGDEAAAIRKAIQREEEWQSDDSLWWQKQREFRRRKSGGSG